MLVYESCAEVGTYPDELSPTLVFRTGYYSTLHPELRIGRLRTSSENRRMLPANWQ